MHHSHDTRLGVRMLIALAVAVGMMGAAHAFLTRADSGTEAGAKMEKTVSVTPSDRSR